MIPALAVGAMVALGVTVGVVADPVAPPAAAAQRLTPFADCDALKKWYVDHTIDQVGPYGWGGRWSNTFSATEPMTDVESAEPTGSAARDGVANGSTGTNTQEAGVDEPDVAKTNGRIVVQIREDQRLVTFTDVSGSSARLLAEWRIPEGSFVDSLLIVNDHVLLAGARHTGIEPLTDRGDGIGMIAPIGGSGGTELIDLDISDPAHPRLDSVTSWSGSQLSLRQYGDTVRLVTSTGLPALPFVEPRPGRLTEEEAEQRNREIVRSSSVEDWVPGLSSESGSASGWGPLVGCGEVYRPRTWAGSDTVAVATFSPGDVGDASAVAVTGAGSEVYSSVDRLYVTGTSWDSPWPVNSPMSAVDPDSSRSSSRFAPMPNDRTHIHAFVLDGASTRYVASGAIDGSLRDRWSLDEHDGHLRVAVSWHNRRGDTSDSGVVVLDERDGRLEQVAKLRGLGVDEEIQSVRWFDDLAIVVTFRQVDPLYTIDLRDPADPRRLGELKIPGFSSYLHPIGGERLLGIGTDAARDGRSLGAQAAVFDVGDPARARQVDKVTFGKDSWLAASEDPHAFTWLPDANAAITSLQRFDSWGMAGQQETGPEMVLLRIAPSGSVSTEELPSPGGWAPRALPLDSGRVALVGTTIEIVSVER